jgi:hypothetical protein
MVKCAQMHPRRPKIELVYFNAGGGHRAAARALEQVLGAGAAEHEVRTTNVMEVLDPSGLFRRVTGMAPEDYYNKRLASGFTAGLSQELKVFQGLVRLAHASLVGALEQHWLRSEPDLVVSLIPNLNRPLCASLARALPGVPYLTVMTDLADLPPDFWMVPDQPQHVVCGTETALGQAISSGCDPRRVHRASGMILRPDFYGAEPVDREEGRRALGLDPRRPTGLVLFGGHGSRAMLSLAEDLHDVQLIFLCGHNARLASRLKSRPAGRAPHAVLGFTPDVHRYMRLADFFIGKPGPGSLSEAVHCGLPVVTVLNTWTMPQERFNPRWIADQGLGIAASSFGRLRGPVMQLLDRLPDYADRVRAMPPNRAVFEVTALVRRMLDRDLQSNRHIGLSGCAELLEHPWTSPSTSVT